MTVEMGERTGDSQVSKIEIEEKVSSNLSYCEDLGKVDAEGNGIVHDCVEASGGYVKDDGDGSFVFVGGPDAVSDDHAEKDLDAECVADPADTLETMPAVEGETVSEPIVDSQSGEKQVVVGELSIGKVGNDQFPVENGCSIDESVVSYSSNGAAVESSHSQLKGNEVEKTDPADEQSNTALAPEVVRNEENMITTAEAAELEVPLLDRDEEKENVPVPFAEVEADEVEESRESITVKEAVECELQQLDTEEKVEEFDSVKETEEQSKLNSETEVKENPETENMVKGSAESKSHQLHNGEKDGGEPRILDLAIKEENQESQVTDMKDVELEFGQLDNREEDLGDNPSGGIRLEDATGPAITQLEAESLNGAIECGTSLPSDPVDSDTEVINDLAVGNGNMMYTVDIKQESENVDGSAENSASLPHLVDEVVQETGVGNISVEDGESYPTETVDNMISEAEVRNPCVKISESLPLEGTMLETVVANGSTDGVKSRHTCIAGNGNSENEICNGSVEGDVAIPTCPAGNLEIESEAINGFVASARSLPSFSVDDVEVESEGLNCSVKNGSSLPTSHVADVVQETEVGNISVEDGESFSTETADNMISEAEVKNPCVKISESLPLEGTMLETVVANGSTDGVEIRHACIASNGKSENGICNGSVEGDVAIPTCPAGNVEIESEDISGSAASARSLPSFSVDDVEVESDGLNCSVKNGSSLPTCRVADVVQETEVGNISLEDGESFPTETVDNMISEAEVKNPCVKISESLPLEGTMLETVVANGSTDGVESRHTCIAGNGKSENEICNGSVEDDVAIPTCPAENLEIESEAINGSAARARSLPGFSVDDVEVESDGLNCSVKNGSSLPTCHVADVEQEPEARNGSGGSDNCPSGNAVNLGAIVQDGSVENGGTEAHSVNDVIDEKEGMQSTIGENDGKLICQEVDTEGIQGDKVLQSSPEAEGSTANAVNEQKVDTEVVKKAFHFLIRIPRYIDDKLKEQIRLAQIQVEERTQSRDAIRATIQMKRAICNEYRDKFEAAKLEERIARDAFSAKRQEIDSVQSAISIDDIDDRIHNMEHMIQHETMPLKEEKQLIREIKQLKLLREQLSSHMGRQDEHQQASDQRDSHEERFKLLKQELDSLRKKVSQTEGITKVAKEKYFEENEKLRKLQSQFKDADVLRQEAYANLQNLRKELYEKNNYFRMYKDELRVANDYASTGDREALQRLCVNQVETLMELWNKNDEFRKEYIRCNTMSILRRLTTLDGRSLGPGEEPPVIHLVDERVDNVLVASSQIDSALVVSPSESEKAFVLGEAEKGNVKSVVRVQQENETARSKKASKPTALENGSATFSGREEKDEVEEENKKSKEEEELARKAEELRKEEATARLKEQRRLEEKVKAKEAEERKRRNAEKAQARAELRAQREAELKEKEREKRAKKKERKKAATVEGANVGTEGESAPCSENTPSETTIHESEIKERTTAGVNRPKKSLPLAKQSKTKPLPPPLRNRGKRRMQTWMWFLMVTLLVLALFFLGSVGISFKFGLPSFGF
ncbi:uncharacterized protein LOC122661811 [Telopea speciosissima]|uniref:uncharacterized protein LOC122661811 n=1 Tax=Telopea speciosissima TaxID=54955 RepID=UPI001CC6CB75|nr:uncharacterized protein LOC122661811 [Telopea speciosissima]